MKHSPINKDNNKELKATDDVLSKAMITAIIRRHIHLIAKVEAGEDIRTELSGCRTSRYNTLKKIKKQLANKGFSDVVK